MTKSKPSTSQEFRKLEGNTLIESIGELLEAKTSLMVSEIKLNIATNVKDLKLDSATLKSELKSDMSTLKSDMATNAEELKSDMANKIKASHDDLMNRVGAFDACINKVAKLTTSVSILIQPVDTKLSENSMN